MEFDEYIPKRKSAIKDEIPAAIYFLKISLMLATLLAAYCIVGYVEV